MRYRTHPQVVKECVRGVPTEQTSATTHVCGPRDNSFQPCPILDIHTSGINPSFVRCWTIMQSGVACGTESLTDAYSLLDTTPYGRQQAFEDSPSGWPQKPTYG